MEKKYNHTESEAAIQSRWEQEKTYLNNSLQGTVFSIDTPPPTVSGTLHIGHIFSYTQTDIIARYKRMSGYTVLYPFGFDDNGLPTERYVEKKCNVRSHTMQRSEFINLCLQETKAAHHSFTELWKKMGISADWTNTYSTISNTVRTISQNSFLKLLEKKQVYRQYEPAIYCTQCRTSVAQAELDDALYDSVFNTIVFTDHTGNDILIGTTRPELLPSCVALLYHPNDKRYVYLKNQHVTTPLFKDSVPVLEDELVDPEKGTGLVMVCTFGDKTDIEWYKKYNLSYRQSIGTDGKFMSHIPLIAGLSVLEARATIIKALSEKNLLIAQKPINHSVGVHERCKKPVEFLMLAQWFVKILDHKKALLEIANLINWSPSFMKSRYINWVENVQWDWGISRQRLFGIPFPVWHCQDCTTVIPATEKELPLDPQETHYKGVCPACGSSQIVPDTDVMDTWNTSSLTPYICAHLFGTPLEHLFESNDCVPMSMRPQAHDIIRTWAFDTIVKTYLHHNSIPWKEIVISGHVLSEHQEKISKSKGTSLPAPEALLKEYSADAIRYWTASCSLGQDTAFSSEQLKIGQRLITKLWNAFVFAEPHISTIKATSELPSSFGVVNEWLLHTISTTENVFHTYFQKHEFGLALNALEHFFWKDYCDNYIELVKHQLFNPQDYSTESVYATQWTLYQVGLRILQLYAPYIPHVTETVYKHLYEHNEKKSSLHQTNFTTYQTAFIFEHSSHVTNKLIEIASCVRKLKTMHQISLKTTLKELTIATESVTTKADLELCQHIIKGVTQAQTVLYSNDIKQESNIEQKEDNWYAYVIIQK